MKEKGERGRQKNLWRIGIYSTDGSSRLRSAHEDVQSDPHLNHYDWRHRGPLVRLQSWTRYVCRSPTPLASFSLFSLSLSNFSSGTKRLKLLEVVLLEGDLLFPLHFPISPFHPLPFSRLTYFISPSLFLVFNFSWSINNYGPRIIQRNFDPGFFVEHFIKGSLT